MPAIFAKPKAMRLVRAAVPPFTLNEGILTFPSADMEVRGSGKAGAQHRLASWTAPVKVPRNVGVYGVRATAHWYQHRGAWVRATIVVSVGSAVASLTLPAVLPFEAPDEGPEEAASGTLALFDILDWPATTQFETAPPERGLTIPIMISIVAQQFTADAEFIIGVNDLDLVLLTYEDGAAE